METISKLECVPDVASMMATVPPCAITRARIIVCDRALFPFLNATNPPINTAAVVKAPGQTDVNILE